ncbi:hypothetical protein J6590_032261 [Homalodisca vitripennis]|nr:hypothetical protein J6590_032261 [Homalodisca vitripennis]
MCHCLAPYSRHPMDYISPALLLDFHIPLYLGRLSPSFHNSALPHHVVRHYLLPFRNYSLFRIKISTQFSTSPISLSLHNSTPPHHHPMDYISQALLLDFHIPLYLGRLSPSFHNSALPHHVVRQYVLPFPHIPRLTEEQSTSRPRLSKRRETITLRVKQYGSFRDETEGRLERWVPVTLPQRAIIVKVAPWSHGWGRSGHISPSQTDAGASMIYGAVTRVPEGGLSYRRATLIYGSLSSSGPCQYKSSCTFIPNIIKCRSNIASLQ